VRGDLLPRIRDLDTNLPSPYLTGLLDEFFDDKLHPLVQTSRGCPYSCTFCHDGIAYMNKTPRFSQEHIDEELEYISQRVKVPGLSLADLNWGMFPDDIKTAQTLAELQRKTGWPVQVASATAKNQKERIVEMSQILGGSMMIGASVQSTDSEVLSIIKRANIGFDAIVKMAKGSVQTGTPTFSEIILCLPGDTKEKHMKSIFDMMDANIQDMRTYQFILLPGTESGSDESREKYHYQTRFRVLPRCFGRYQLYGGEISVAEMHEVCVANDTLPLEDYLACRDFHLSLSIFNNGNLFEELWALVQVLQVSRSDLFLRMHDMAVAPGSTLETLYADYRADESRNFWNSREELVSFLSQPEGFDAYLSGHYGANQIFKFRSVAAFELLEDVVELAFSATRQELRSRDLHDPIIDQYLEELREVLIARKSRVLDVELSETVPVHFDFGALEAEKYLIDPREVYARDGLEVSVFHSDYHQKYLTNYFRQYGATLDGLTYFIHRHPAHMLYRQIEMAGTKPKSLTLSQI